MPAAKLYGANDRYKIKLRRTGYRLVYEVRDERLAVIAATIGRRDRSAVQDAAKQR